MTDQPTQVLPVEAAPERDGRRRWLRVLLRVGIPVLAVVLLLVVADTVTRSIVEQRVAGEIEKSLPNTVKADVTVHLGGFSVLQQLAAGRFESVELDAPTAKVNGAVLSATVHATGPVDFAKPIHSATGTLDISEDSLNRLVSVPGATGGLTLGDGVIGYDGRIDLLGLPVDYRVSAKPKAAGTTVLLQPDKANISTGTGDVNISRLLQSLTASGPFPVCAAQYLPDGVDVTGIRVKPGRASVTLTARDFVLNDAFLGSKGSCS